MRACVWATWVGIRATGILYPLQGLLALKNSTPTPSQRAPNPPQRSAASAHSLVLTMYTLTLTPNPNDPMCSPSFLPVACSGSWSVHP